MTAANSPTLVKDLQRRVKLLTDDLRTRSDDPTDTWGQELNAEYRTATERGRTGLSWSEWRDGEVDLAAVAWVLATVFIRFCEDNDLIDGPWITGEGVRHGQAADNETAFYQAEPSRNARDWLRAGFSALAGLPAGRSLLDQHNLVWRAPISADAAQQLLTFWRQQNADGTLDTSTSPTPNSTPDSSATCTRTSAISQEEVRTPADPCLRRGVHSRPHPHTRDRRVRPRGSETDRPDVRIGPLPSRRLRPTACRVATNRPSNGHSRAGPEGARLSQRSRHQSRSPWRSPDSGSPSLHCVRPTSRG